MLGLPDEIGRLAILRLFTARMPTVGVDLEQLAGETEGFSPADLKALDAEAAVRAEDFDAALERSGKKAGPAAPVGFR